MSADQQSSGVAEIKILLTFIHQPYWPFLHLPKYLFKTVPRASHLIGSSNRKKKSD